MYSSTGLRFPPQLCSNLIVCICFAVTRVDHHLIFCLSRIPLSTPNQKEQMKIKPHLLKLQLHQLQSINTTITLNLNNDALTIAQLTQNKEEARQKQKVAMWEPKWVVIGRFTGDTVAKNSREGSSLATKVICIESD